jgi:hypothetical protein
VVTMFGDLQNLQNNQIPQNPLKQWRTLFDQKNLDVKEIIQYFQICAPFFISVTQKDSNALGELLLLSVHSINYLISSFFVRFFESILFYSCSHWMFELFILMARDSFKL